MIRRSTALPAPIDNGGMIPTFRALAVVTLLSFLPGALAAAAPPWFEATRPGPHAWQAIELLSAADSHGLNPHDYQADRLRHALKQAANETPNAEQIDSLERTLTVAMQRYLEDLHRGRVDPRRIAHAYVTPKDDAFNAAAVLQAAFENGRLAEAVRDAAPRFAQYERLREALAQYRALIGHAAGQAPLAPLPQGLRGAPKLEPGQPYAGLPLLRERLISVGDLAAGTGSGTVYDGALVDAVKSFQQRHGLAPDGVIGKATLAQLQVPPAARVRQIELTLERLRWTPLLQGPRMIVINIPEFVLRAYEVRGSEIVVRETMKVIVGKALDTRTPLIHETMRSIEFSPYWNVPPSIARGEVVPRLRRDPGYFAREGFEFVTAQGEVVGTLTTELLDAVRSGNARIRQRPGPRNALGDIKFVFPNREHIFLHHTPSVQLFERDRRDFSHGCIRVERPVALAQFALRGMPEWTEERIRQAMRRGESAAFRLAEPVPVLIAYGTVIVKDGRIHFYDDIYGHDRRLDTTLAEPRPPLPIP